MGVDDIVKDSFDFSLLFIVLVGLFLVDDVIIVFVLIFNILVFRCIFLVDIFVL